MWLAEQSGCSGHSRPHHGGLQEGLGRVSAIARSAAGTDDRRWGGFWVAATPAAAIAPIPATRRSAGPPNDRNENVNTSVCGLSIHQSSGPAHSSHASHGPRRGTATQNAIREQQHVERGESVDRTKMPAAAAGAHERRGEGRDRTRSGRSRASRLDFDARPRPDPNRGCRRPLASVGLESGGIAYSSARVRSPVAHVQCHREGIRRRRQSRAARTRQSAPPETLRTEACERPRGSFLMTLKTRHPRSICAGLPVRTHNLAGFNHGYSLVALARPRPPPGARRDGAARRLLHHLLRRRRRSSSACSPASTWPARCGCSCCCSRCSRSSSLAALPRPAAADGSRSIRRRRRSTRSSVRSATATEDLAPGGDRHRSSCAAPRGRRATTRDVSLARGARCRVVARRRSDADVEPEGVR